MATTMSIPLAAFGVWALVAVIGSVVASLILAFLSWTDSSQKSKQGTGLKSLAGAKSSKTKTTTSPLPKHDKTTTKEESTDEENLPNTNPKVEQSSVQRTDASEKPNTEPEALRKECFVQTEQVLYKEQQESVFQTKEYPFLLPPRRPDDPRHLTVVLDLDETLVRSCEEAEVPVELEFAASMGSLQRIEIQCVDPEGGPPDRIMSFLRPGVFQFLNQLSSFAEVVVFTAGDVEYAAPLIAQLDPDSKTFQGSLFRDATVKTMFHDHVKDLSCLGRDPRFTILVDNNPFSFLFQPDNGVLCEPFFGDPADQHLLQVVLPLLKILACVNDVRPLLRRRYNLAGWCNTLPWQQMTILSQQT